MLQAVIPFKHPEAESNMIPLTTSIGKTWLHPNLFAEIHGSTGTTPESTQVSHENALYKVFREELVACLEKLCYLRLQNNAKPDQITKPDGWGSVSVRYKSLLSNDLKKVLSGHQSKTPDDKVLKEERQQREEVLQTAVMPGGIFVHPNEDILTDQVLKCLYLSMKGNYGELKNYIDQGMLPFSKSDYLEQLKQAPSELLDQSQKPSDEEAPEVITVVEDSEVVDDAAMESAVEEGEQELKSGPLSQRASLDSQVEEEKDEQADGTGAVVEQDKTAVIDVSSLQSGQVIAPVTRPTLPSSQVASIELQPSADTSIQQQESFVESEEETQDPTLLPPAKKPDWGTRKRKTIDADDNEDDDKEGTVPPTKKTKAPVTDDDSKLPAKPRKSPRFNILKLLQQNVELI